MGVASLAWYAGRIRTAPRVAVVGVAGCAWYAVSNRTILLGLRASVRGLCLEWRAKQNGTFAVSASRLASGGCVAGVAGGAKQQNHSRNEQKLAVLAFCCKRRTMYRQTENTNRTKIKRVYGRLLF